MDGGQGGGGTGADGVEGEEDQDEPSSSSNLKDNLRNFRHEWKKEIADSVKEKDNVVQNQKNNGSAVEFNVEDKAKVLFQLGVENEVKGNLYDAVQFYKKAFILVPDIEIRLAQQNLTNISNEDDGVEEEKDRGSDSDSNESCDSSERVEFNPQKTDLLTHLQTKIYHSPSKSICQPQRPTNGEKHLSDLPLELVLYIMRWVVGSELDLRSLEQFGAVCRGLYVCSRDSEIWKIACHRVWGLRCVGLGLYQNWREMYIHRPRVQTGGCYISKTTYIRHGENSFQDICYRPWHLVQYFRYLRFFSDGTVIMLTSADEPVHCVGQLRRKHLIGTTCKAGPIFTGYYRLLEHNVVSIVVSPDVNSSTSKKVNNMNKHTFHLELEIVTYRNRVHGQLVWRRYVLFTSLNGIESSTNFELIANRFPPFWFSRVKSYLQESSAPLL